MQRFRVFITVMPVGEQYSPRRCRYLPSILQELIADEGNAPKRKVFNDVLDVFSGGILQFGPMELNAARCGVIRLQNTLPAVQRQLE